MNLPKLNLNKGKEKYFQAFFIAFLIALAFFGIYIIADKGYFLYYGDFNVQQVSFYKVAHKAIREGNIFWNWNTDLGANFIGSYSFYLLGSPFFWLTIPFPTDFVPHLMGPLLILKFSCASLTAYCFIRRFTKTSEAALIGGLLYAFSGFSIYNIFFNHFHEAIVFFPVLLLAIELFMCENKRGYVVIATFLCALVNYYFFFGMVLFSMIYWFIRLFSGAYKFKIKNFLWFCFELILGVLMAAVILLPSFFTVIANSRVSSHISGWGGLLYNKPQQFLYIIQCFFFPPDNPARPVFFPSADVKWSSVAGWMPLVGMTGVFAWLQTKKGTWQKRLITTCVFIALIPVLNSAFSLFNTSYYARWFYMPILIMALVTVQAFESPDVNWASAFRWSIGVTLAFVIGIGLFPSNYSSEEGFFDFGLYNEANVEGSFYHARFWIECLIALSSQILLLIFTLIRGNLKKCKSEEDKGEYYARMQKNWPVFWRSCLSAVCVISVLYSAIHIGWGKEHSYDTQDYIIPVLLEGEKITLDINDGERTDVYEGMDNTGMFLDYPCIQCFHSVVPASVMEFWEYVGVTRNVASRPETEYYQARSLLNVRYLFDYTGDSNKFQETSGATKMPGYVYYKTQNEYDVYENKYYIPYGAQYEYCISRSEADENFDDKKCALMLKALILEDEDVEKYSKYITHSTVYSAFNQNGYLSDCETLRETSLDNTFTIDKKTGSFTSTVSVDSPRLAFYSIPYEGGWTAFVDGKETEIIKANIGFMAVALDEGEHTVEFKYMTPGLSAGAIITLISAVMLAVYLVLFNKYKAKHPEKIAVLYPEGEKLKSEYAYLDSLFTQDENTEQTEFEIDEKALISNDEKEDVEILEIIDFGEDDGYNE